ncbi:MULTISPECIES: hypothetical protein [Rhodococcus]|uniref:Membrane-associated oxidoreductase n=1 Tax=Rhodococcus jostii (strain RHA1) TaxID=101510 RepID=Q0RWT3_RHOJR|nr:MULTISPECIES: hypothetical protein [Rhodococcus]ABH00253.1 conserved hypothetical protein [Rhodococcus jostii RHA1]
MPTTRPLTKTEQQILDDLVTGVATDCRASDGSRRRVSGQFIRDVLRGVVDPDLIPDPHGLRLVGAEICGELDLCYLVTQIPLSLEDCTSSDSISAEDANLTSLTLKNCHWTTVDGSALNANGLQVTHDACFEGFEATSTGADAVQLVGASIGGQLNFRGAHLVSDTCTALQADGLSAAGVFCDEGFTATSTGGDAVRLPGATVGGPMTFGGAHLESKMGTALHADGLSVTADMLCNEGFKATSTEKDAVSLSGASIGAQLNFEGAHLDSKAGTALDGDGLRVTAGMFCNEGFKATSTKKDAVRLPGATVGSELNFKGAHVDSKAGTALQAHGLRVTAGMFCNEGFKATSTKKDAVSLLGANIGGQLNFKGAHLESKAGTALQADSLSVAADMFCDEQFTATSTDADAVRLIGANIGGQLICGAGANGKPCVSSLNLRDASVNSLLLPTGFGPGSGLWLNVDGLTYPHVPQDMSADEWIECLQRHTAEYAMQPWRQLASTYTASGHDQEARKVLIAQQTYHRQWLKTQGTGDKAGIAFRRALSWVTGKTTGYGYQTWRAALGLFIVVILSMGLGWASGNIHADTPGPGVYVAQHSRLTSNEGQPCTKTERLALGIQIGLPLIKLPASDRCKLDTTAATGQVITVLSWILQLLGWAFATLVIAGYTGLIRRL